MPQLKRGARVAAILMLVAIVTSACNQPYSQQPSVTNTPIDPNSLFATPLPTGMSDVQKFATQTALGNATAAPASATPAGVTPQPSATFTATPIVNLPSSPTFTSTATLAATGPSATPLPVGSRPSTYTLQRGEFPFCIARRFNVNPDELLAINGLASGDIYYSGLSLKIPQTGNPFPGNRMLRTHPTTYTVASSDETVYGVACVFGDIDPSRIAQENNISVGAALSVGQQLKIP